MLLRAVAHARHEVRAAARDSRRTRPAIGSASQRVGGGEQDQRAGAVDQDVPDAGDQRDDGSRGSPGRSASRGWRCGRRSRSGRTPSDWRTTCQWLCQRMRFETLAAIAWLVSRFCVVSASGRSDQQHQRHAEQQRPVIGEQLLRLARGDSVTTRPMNIGIMVSSSATTKPATNSAANSALRLAGEMPIERDQPGRRLRAARAWRSASTAVRTARTWHKLANGPRPRRRRAPCSCARICAARLAHVCTRRQRRHSQGLTVLYRGQHRFVAIMRLPCGPRCVHFAGVTRSIRPLRLSVSSQIAPSGPWRTSRMRSLRLREQALFLGDLLAVELEPHQQLRRRARRRTGCPSRPGTGRRCRTPCRRARSTAPST